MEDVSQIVFVLPTYLQIIVHKSLLRSVIKLFKLGPLRIAPNNVIQG